MQIVLPARVLDAILQNASKLSKREILVLLAIWRHTLEQNRIEARLSLRCLDSKLGISHKKIFPALRLLIEKHLVLQKKRPQGAVLSINLEHAWFGGLKSDSKEKDSSQKKSGNAPARDMFDFTAKRPCTPCEDISEDISKDAIRREWARIFRQPLPEGMEKKANALLEEIRRGHIKPETIRFPIKYLERFHPPNRIGSGITIRDGMQVRFRGGIYTVENSGMIHYENGVIPYGDILRLIEKGEMSVVGSEKVK